VLFARADLRRACIYVLWHASKTTLLDTISFSHGRRLCRWCRAARQSRTVPSQGPGILCMPRTSRRSRRPYTLRICHDRCRIPPHCSSPHRNHCARPTLALPRPSLTTLEHASACFPRRRTHGQRQMPLLRHRVPPQAGLGRAWTLGPVNTNTRP